MQRNLGWGKLLQSTSQTIVVGVNVGNHYLRDIFKVNANLRQMISQGIECLSGIPAGINQETFSIAAYQIGVDMFQGNIREWQCQTENTRYDLVHISLSLQVVECLHSGKPGILP